MRSLLTTLAFLLPFQGLKKKILNRLGHSIHPTAYVGINLVRHVNKVVIAEGAGIGNFNLLGWLDLVELGVGARLSYLNMVTSGYTGEANNEDTGTRRTLRMGAHSRIVTMHIIDCSGGFILGDECWVTGMRSQILTHAFDPHDGGIIVEPVELKRGSVLATACTLLPGSVLGEGALLAAGSTLWTRQEVKAESLAGGVPARRLSPIKISDWVYNWQRYGGPVIQPATTAVEAESEVSPED